MIKGNSVASKNNALRSSPPQFFNLI